MNRLDVKSNMNQEAGNDESRAEEDASMDPPHMSDDDDDDDDNATDTRTDDDNDTGTGAGTDTETDQDDDDENEDEQEEEADRSDDEDVSDDESIVVIPTPDNVEHEYTYPQDFVGRSWQDVVPRGHYFRLILDPSCTKIPKEKFQSCHGLIEIVVPDDSCLTMIGIDSFMGCINLQRITNGLPATLLIIDKFAFSECRALHGQLVIPPNITRLGDQSFSFCSKLTSVVFQSSTTATTLEIGNDCFTFCTELLSMDLSERIDELVDTLFYYCSSLNRIIIRSSNMRFGNGGFQGCPSSLTIEAYPWLYPKIFASMHNNPSLIYRNFHQYHHRILGEAKIADDGVVTRQHPNGRRRQQLHKKQRL